MIEIYKTGVVYHLIHALTIAAIGLNNDKKYNISLIFFAIGIVLFSSSLYAYAISGIKFLVFVTPIGGISFLFGWLLLIIKGISKSKEETT